MPEKQNPEMLKNIVFQTLRIYEQARLERFRWEQQAVENQKAQRQALQKEKDQAAQSAPDQSGLSLATNTQEKLGQLRALSEAVVALSAQLLEKAGLAHALGAPVTPDAQAYRADQAPEKSAAAFREAQLAYADLRLALFHLAQASLEQKQWESARRLAQPLLFDAEAPLYSEARTLLCESHYRPAVTLLAGQKWEAARLQFEEVQKIIKPYRDISAGLAETYWQPAREALALSKLEDAERLAKLAQNIDPQNANAAQILTQVREQRQRLEDEKRRLEEGRKRQEQEKHMEGARQMIKSIALVNIPAGKFLYGENKAPYNMASEYMIGKYPVTNAQFTVFEDAAGYEKLAKRDKALLNHPVVNVSWNDAVAFCEWASKVSGSHYRLPGDAEWEKAARGTDGRNYPWGNQAPDASRCNFNNLVGAVTPGGNYSPQGDSSYGCCDMVGNVWEWCADNYQNGKSLRGGALYDNAAIVRCAYRHSNSPDFRNVDLGFRVCVSPI